MSRCCTCHLGNKAIKGKMSLKEKFSIRDKGENRIYMDDDGKIFLHPVGEKPFHIGVIYTLPDGKLVYLKFEDERHIPRNISLKKPWGIYLHILRRVDFVKYITHRYSYYIDSERALNCGEFLTFDTSWIDTKIYVPVDLWIKRGRKKYKKAA